MASGKQMAWASEVHPPIGRPIGPHGPSIRAVDRDPIEVSAAASPAGTFPSHARKPEPEPERESAGPRRILSATGIERSAAQGAPCGEHRYAFSTARADMGAFRAHDFIPLGAL
jgi:hypothetical protein